MPTTTNGFPYPAASDAPDGPGGIYNLATTIDTKLGTTTSGTWTPGISGSGGATSGGSGSGYSGSWTNQGGILRFVGSVLFGAGATFGNGTTLVTNIPAAVNTGSANGTGWYTTTGGGIQQVFFLAASPTTFRLLQPVSGSFANFTGSISNGDRLSFTFHAIAA